MTDASAYCHVCSVGIALAALGVLLVLPRAALADEGPILVAEQPKLDPLQFAPPSAWLDFNYFRADQTQTTNGQAPTRFTEDQFQEILTLQTTGAIVHRNLVDLRLQGSFGLEQDLLDEDGKHGTVNGTFYGWDLGATLFRKEEIPIDLYSRRITTYYNQPFGPSLENTLTTDGVVLNWQNQTVPTRVEYYHLDQYQKALAGSQTYQLDSDVVTWHSSYQPTNNNRSAFDYTFNTGYSKSNTTNFGGANSNNFIDHYLSLTNELDFGRESRSYLQSSILFTDESGTFELTDLRYNESLYLQHTDNFATAYHYLLDQIDVGSGFGGSGTDQLLQRADAQFIHHLFKSLTTTGVLAFQDLNISPSGGETDYSATINFAYDKIVPLGKLDANLSVGYDLTNNSGTTQETHVVNQQFTFAGSLPLIIRGNSIIASSLLITDSSGVRIFIPGVDYVVQAFPDFVEVQRLLGGNIADGQTVLISYTLSAQPATTLRTNSFSGGARYSFERGFLRGLGVYAQYTDIDQNVSGNVSFIPASLVDTTVGADYQIWELKFLAEQDWHHSSISPYDQFRAEVRWLHPLGDRATATLNGGYIGAHFPQTGDRLTNFNAGASISYLVTSELSVNAAIQWEDQHDRLFGPTRGLEEQFGLQWSHRSTTAYLQFRNSDLDYSIQSNHVQTIQVGIRRTF